MNLEKMINGENYDANDPLLVKMRHECRILLKEYNNTFTFDLKSKEILKSLLKYESDSYIEPPFYCDYGFNIKLGKNCYFNFSCTILDCAEVIIGDNLFCGPNVSIYTATHPLNYEKRNSGIEFAKKITIGNNVWIGGNAVILPGINIGDNVVIAAGSIVTKSFPNNVLIAGNPAIILKEI